MPNRIGDTQKPAAMLPVASEMAPARMGLMVWPKANPTVNGMTEALLTVRIPFDDRDLAAGREEFACHRSQYAPAEMDSVNAYLAHTAVA